MIIIGSDHRGVELKKAVTDMLEQNDVAFTDCGTNSRESVDYPVYAAKVCHAVQSGEAALGILICGTGLGMSIAANKHKSIRAACLSDTYSAKMARMHNDANVLCIGADVAGTGLALELVKIFISTDFIGGKHSNRVDMLNSL